MPFDFCAKHSKRYEGGYSVCAGCHQTVLDQLSNAPVSVPKSNGAFNKQAYQREYMRKRRATKGSQP